MPRSLSDTRMHGRERDKVEALLTWDDSGPWCHADLQAEAMLIRRQCLLRVAIWHARGQPVHDAGLLGSDEATSSSVLCGQDAREHGNMAPHFSAPVPVSLTVVAGAVNGFGFSLSTCETCGVARRGAEAAPPSSRHDCGRRRCR